MFDEFGLNLVTAIRDDDEDVLLQQIANLDSKLAKLNARNQKLRGEVEKLKQNIEDHSHSR
jgi:cell division protein FtsB